MGRQRIHTKFRWRNLFEPLHLEDREGGGGSAATVSVSKMVLRNMLGCEDGRWMELAQDRVQWRAFVLAVLNLGVLLSVLDFPPLSACCSLWTAGN